MVPEHARRYLLHGLSATPVVIDRMMRDASPEDYDRRPDPERFTLREVIAHLAEWDPIWLERMRRMRDEDEPVLASIDESQRCIEGDYAHTDLPARRACFRAGREALVAFLAALPAEAWERCGRHSEWGAMTIAQLAALVLGHDGYHTRQIAEWLDAEAPAREPGAA